MRPATLRVDGLVVVRGGAPVLRGVSFAARGGHVTGLLGPNGAGKTTTLAAIAGVLPILEGSVEVTSDHGGRSDHVGYAPQETALYPPLSVSENLAVFARYAGIPRRQRRDAVARGLALAALETRGDSRVATLSPGLRRRLSLAVAILGDPAVLALDEPTAGVDPQARRHILESIREIAGRTGAVVILSTHRLDDVEAACERVVIIDGGQVVKRGLVSQVRAAAPALVSFQDPGDIACLRRFGRRRLSVHGGRVAIETRDPATTVIRVAGLLEGSGHRLRELRVREGSLETAFLQITGQRVSDGQ